jgi:hypothetical protein
LGQLLPERTTTKGDTDGHRGAGRQEKLEAFVERIVLDVRNRDARGADVHRRLPWHLTAAIRQLDIDQKGLDMTTSQKAVAVDGDKLEQNFFRVVDEVGTTPGHDARVPGWFARLSARVHPWPLDEALIAGADPAGSAKLAARATTLVSPGFRISIADGLARWLQAAQAPPSRWRVLPRRSAVLANASELSELASLLRGPSPLYAGGIAAVHHLLTDGTGPAYLADADALTGLLHEARAAMCGGIGRFR